MTYPKYRSTRSAEPVSFADALLQGLAPDGGLFVLTFIPQLHGIDFRQTDSIDAHGRLISCLSLLLCSRVSRPTAGSSCRRSSRSSTASTSERRTAPSLISPSTF